MKKNIAKMIYDAYPHSDLFPIDPEKDCKDLKTLVDVVNYGDIGDTLFRFLVIEIYEAGEDDYDRIVHLLQRAKEQVDAVLLAFEMG